MILISVGANLPGPIGSPIKTCATALSLLTSASVTVTNQSHWVKSEPLPPSQQPWFINCVISVNTNLGPEDLLTLLHQVESIFGRKRIVLNEPRSLDLDLLSYHNIVRKTAPILPHPRLHERAFIILPLKEIVPNWYHPIRQQTLTEMAACLQITISSCTICAQITK